MLLWLEIGIIINWVIKEPLRLMSLCKGLISKHLLVDFFSALCHFGESTGPGLHVIGLPVLKEVVVEMRSKRLLLLMMEPVLHIDGVILLLLHHVHVLLVSRV